MEGLEWFKHVLSRFHCASSLFIPASLNLDELSDPVTQLDSIFQCKIFCPVTGSRLCKTFVLIMNADSLACHWIPFLFCIDPVMRRNMLAKSCLFGSKKIKKKYYRTTSNINSCCCLTPLKMVNLYCNRNWYGIKGKVIPTYLTLRLRRQIYCFNYRSTLNIFIILFPWLMTWLTLAQVFHFLSSSTLSLH